MNVQDELEGIYLRHYLMVYRLALAKCGGKIENAEDVFGEVFFQLLKYLKKGKTFNDINHEKAWLIRVTLNCSKVIFRTYSRGSSTELTQEQFYAMMTNETTDVFDAVMELSEKYRVVIHLFYYEDYSIKEIAEIIGVNENTVKSRLLRARKMLKSNIEDRKDCSYEFGKIQN